MKKRKTFKKKLLVLATAASIGTSFTAISPDLVSAAPVQDSKSLVQKEMKSNAAIVDWKVPIQEATEIYGKNLNVPGNYKSTLSMGEFLGDYFDVEYHQFSVEADGSPILDDSRNIFVGKTTLTNNTDQEQTLSTNSFAKTITNSVTNSTTHGFKFGVKASSKFQIPLVGETGIELSTEYNFSDTSSKTSTESFTYTASPQNIKVPAHSSVEVIVNLNSVKAKGDVKLLTKMSGRDNGNFLYDTNQAYVYNLTFNELVAGASKYAELKDISANPDGKTVNVIGKGTYEAEYGTEFSVTVRPVDKGKTNTERSRSKRSINEGYTYKVTPEITKVN